MLMPSTYLRLSPAPFGLQESILLEEAFGSREKLERRAHSNPSVYINRMDDYLSTNNNLSTNNKLL
jgi:hypothetical protein